MEHTRKMVLVPADSSDMGHEEEDEQAETSIKNPEPKQKRDRTAEKIIRLLKVILKLAQIDGYDSLGRIRGQDGSFVSNSNIIHLLMHAMRTGRVLVGEAEFVKLLIEARVEPELLVNDNLKAKLVQQYEGRDTSLVDRVATKRKHPEEPRVISTGTKRLRSEDNDELVEIEEPPKQVPKVKLKRKERVWEVDRPPGSPEYPDRELAKKIRWTIPEEDE